MAIPAVGFCVYLRRVRQEKRTSIPHARTVGEYKCYWNGQAIAELSGQMVERQGPGDNTDAIGNARDLRIKAGTYKLKIHNGTKYKTYDYTSNTNPTKLPRPGILLEDPGERDAILIHPARDYVWSVGCINPASDLVDASSKVVFTDSRIRVIAIIDAMKEKMGNTFPTSGGAVIPNAVIIIEGEPV